MKKIHQRLVALLVVLAMMAMGLTALAEAPKVPNPADVYARGNTLKAEVDLQLDGEAIAGLLGMFAGADEDPSQNPMITSMVSAITKLKTTVLSTMTHASIAVGTDAGTVITVQAQMEGEDALATTDLLPGMLLKVPQEMIKALVDSQSAMQTPDITMEAFLPYAEALNTYLQETVLPSAQLENQVEVPGVGTFANVHSFPITQGLLAELLKSISHVYQEDNALQERLDEYLKSVNSAAAMAEAAPVEGSMVEASPPQSAADLANGLDETIANLNQEPDKVLALQRIYSDENGKATYYETETQADDNQMLVSILDAGMGEDTNLQVELLVNSAAPSYGEPEPTPEPGPVDWAALKAAVLDGSNPYSTLVTLNVKASQEGTDTLSTLGLQARFQGMLLGITADGRTANEGDFASEGTVEISALFPSPVAKVVYKLSEVTEQPAPIVQGGKVMLLQEDDLSEEDEAALEESLKQGLPQLVERLKTALPEEGSVLAMLLQQLTQPEPAPAN